MEKKVIVSGAVGFLGNHIVDNFVDHGWEVTGIDKHKKAKGSRSTALATHCALTLPSERLESLLSTIKPDLFVHAAGTASVSDSISEPLNDYRQSADVLFSILNSIRKQSPNTRLLFLSSAAVYGNPTELPIHENATLQPISPYGYHKLICEKIIEEYHTIFGVQACSVRIFSAYGPGLKRQVLWDLCQKICTQESIRILGAGNETRDFIHAGDVAEGIRVVNDYGSFRGEAYNLACGQEIKIIDLARDLGRLLSRDIKIEADGITRQGFPIRWRANIQKISDLGFYPQIAIREGIQEYVNWFVGEGKKR